MSLPALGPDATALGQVFWYTLEGRDPKTGEPVGGWDLDELRSVQDWNVRYALQSVDGVSEVSSVGGFVREYQIDVNPDLMRHHKITLARDLRCGAQVERRRRRTDDRSQPRRVRHPGNRFPERA